MSKAGIENWLLDRAENGELADVIVCEEIEKLRRALFVACISHFCRSQAMIFAPQEKWTRMHIVHCGVDVGAA